MKNQIPSNAHQLVVLPEPGFAAHEVATRLGSVTSSTVVLCHEQDETALESLGATLICYGGMNLCPSRTDLDDFSELASGFDECILLHRFSARLPNHFLSTLRLLGFSTIHEITVDGERRTSTFDTAPQSKELPKSLLFSFCGGIGNDVLASCVAASAAKLGVETSFCPVADISNHSLATLFDPPPAGVTLVAPEDISSIAAEVSLNVECHTLLKPNDLCHNPYRLGVQGHGPAFLADFVRNCTGIEVDLSQTFVGGQDFDVPEHLQGRVVVCPGSKPGWDSKRWPHMNDLLQQLDNPVVLCREQDLEAYAELDFLTPLETSRGEFITDYNLNQAAGLLRSASAVIANDCGLAHMAAATGTPTLFLFGPSSLEQNEHPRANAHTLALDLDCRPCQGKSDGPGRLAPNDYYCDRDYACLKDISVHMVLEHLQRIHE